jgi:hypothetical protein
MNGKLSRSGSQTPSKAAKRGGLSPQQVIVVLSIIIALQMTSFIMISPLFVKRINEFGTGVQALGISATAYSLTRTLAAPQG